ncbi:uncharacterized protein LOC124607236 [Schistocerca americana]|uniref:uncharacterized protein LOC124607236 n=1 Tax=Schistocerca americana TaxID=7009 RepID=UPI001F4F5830|nr:uncharacterized protein LOC124607236 [Schistocerca americana]XP_049809949.1 uncharacterized protein LOC126252971 [Schistocerca nitens]XP_049863008.1 uncharacterized protein LOC126356231 [Schistocerca gregaria]
MAGRKFLSFFTDKSWSPFSSDNSEQPTRRRLSVSRSGRFKEQKKRRPALEEATFNPEEKTESVEAAKQEANVLPSDWESVVEDIANIASEYDSKNEELERRQETLKRIRSQIQCEQKGAST